MLRNEWGTIRAGLAQHRTTAPQHHSATAPPYHNTTPHHHTTTQHTPDYIHTNPLTPPTMWNTTLARATCAREVYEHCQTYEDLLQLVKHTKRPVFRHLAHAIRNYKSRHPDLTTHQVAFECHRQLTQHPPPHPRKRRVVDSVELLCIPPPPAFLQAPALPTSPEPVLLPQSTQVSDVRQQLASLQAQVDALRTELQNVVSAQTSTPLPSSSSTPILAPTADSALGRPPSECTTCRAASSSVRLLPCGHDAFCSACWLQQLECMQKQQQGADPDRLHTPLLRLRCPVCSQPVQSYNSLQPQPDQVEQLKQAVASLRSMLTQHSTPSPLKSKLIASTHSKHLQVLSIVGDGRCLFYSLLQTQRAMLPLATEADDLRRQLRAHLLSSYTDDEWTKRVPAHMRDTLARQRFAERYLTQSTAHVPIDVVAIWQDMTQFKTDVYLLDRTWQGTGVGGESGVCTVSCARNERYSVAAHMEWRWTL